MKHTLIALMVAFGSALSQTPFAVAQEGSAGVPAMQVKQVAPNSYYVQGLAELGSSANQNFISNAGFVITPAGVVVIDALGSPELARRLIAQIRKITDKPLKTVIVTHYHADHVYGLQVFKEAGARIVAHEASGEYLNSDTARLRLDASRQELFPWVDESTKLLPPDEPIKGAKKLVVGGVDFELIPVGPSHTPDDLVVWLPQSKVLFAGDLVFRNRIPFVGQADSRQWIESLNTLLKFPAKVMVPGHGPASTNPKQDMSLTRDYLVYLRQTMGKGAAELVPFDEVYKNTDWSRFSKVPMFQYANRMNAYNTYLLMEREGQ
jgi:glyoxylase-like metal-dependent hydrolase (beta-lactamase superfamily II)